MINDPDKIILTVQDLLDEAHTQPIDSVGGEAAEREQEAKLKDARVRRDEEWSLLANQVVGGETGIFPEAKSARESGENDAPSSNSCG